VCLSPAVCLYLTMFFAFCLFFRLVTVDPHDQVTEKVGLMSFNYSSTQALRLCQRDFIDCVRLLLDYCDVMHYTIRCKFFELIFAIMTRAEMVVGPYLSIYPPPPQSRRAVVSILSQSSAIVSSSQKEPSSPFCLIIYFPAIVSSSQKKKCCLHFVS
jgi:hypothetical protein